MGGAATRRAIPWLTLSIGFVLVLVFVAGWVQDGLPLLRGGGRLEAETLLRWGACEAVALRVDGQWWRLFSGLWVHGAWWHLALNLWAWLALGSWLEIRVGRRALCGVALLSGLGSTAAAMCFSAAPAVVGWSGAIFGVGGYLGMRSRHDLRALRDFPAGELAGWLALSLVLGWVWEAISQAGHVGGLVVGLALGISAARPRLRWMYVLDIIALVVIGGSAIWGASWARPVQMEAEGAAYLMRGDGVRAVERLESSGWDLLAMDAGAQNELAYALALQGERLDLAEDLSEASLAAAPTEPAFLDTRGWIACRQGESAIGLAWIEAALAGTRAEDPVLRDHLRDCASASVSGASG